MSVPPITFPHWSDPRCQAVALAIYDDAGLAGFTPFPRSEAVTFWPGMEARKFIAMMDAYLAATAELGEKSGDPA